MPRLLLADDHAIVAEGLARLLPPEFTLVGVATTGAALLDLAARHRPDVIVADLAMPTLSGLDALRRLRAGGDTTPFVFLTMHADVTSATRALEAGASGYVLKHAASDELVTAVRDALGGRTFISPALRSPALDAQLARGATDAIELTPRQREVLNLLAEGRSAKEIGAILGISHRTAETHKYAMMDALGLATTAVLVRYAIRHGLVDAGRTP